MAVRNKYQRFGLRADRNLSDLQDNSVALGNVLDDLVADTNFTGFDLKVIDGLRNTNLRQSDLAELSGQQSTYIPIGISGGITVVGDPEPTTPVLTVQNVIDNRKTILGKIPEYKGGSGPRAIIFQGSTLSANNWIGQTPIFDASNTNNISSNDYWLDGNFGFSGSFHPSFTDGFGGIQFEGYLGLTDDDNISLNTNGLFLIEKKYPSLGFVPILSNRANEGRIFTFNNTISNTTSFSVTVSSNSAIIDGTTESNNRWIATNIFEGDTFTINSSKFEVTQVTYDLLTERNDGNSVDIVVNYLEGPSTDVSASVNDTVILDRFTIGESAHKFSIPGDKLFDGELKNYRMTIWWPEPSTVDPTDTRQNYTAKYATFDFGDIGGENPAPYNFWYEVHPDLEGELYSYRYFLNNKLSMKNEKTDTFVESTKQVFSTYQPQVGYRNVMYDPNAKVRWMGDYKFKLNINLDISPSSNDYQDEKDHNAVAIEAGDRLILKCEYIPPLGTSDTIWAHFTIYEVDDDGRTFWVDPNGLSPADLFATPGFLISGQIPKPDFDPDLSTYTNDGSIFDPIVILKPDGLQGIYYVNSQTGNQISATGVALKASQAYATQNTTTYPLTYGFPSDNRYALENIKQDNISYDVGVGTTTQNAWLSGTANTGPGVGTNYGSRIVESFANTITANTTNGSETIPSRDILAHEWTGGSGNFHTNPLGNNLFAVYSHKGLDDSSVALQCVGVYGKEVKNFPEVPINDDVIAVDSTEGIDVGDYVTFEGIITNPTTVTQIGNGSANIVSALGTTYPNGIYTDPNGNTYHVIKISTTVTNNLPNAYTLYFIKGSEIGRYSSQGGAVIQDVSFCVLPFNTAPPFLSTETGLSTSLEYPHLDTTGGSLVFEEFTLAANSSIVTTANTATYNRYVEIQDNQGNTFFLIASNAPVG